MSRDYTQTVFVNAVTEVVIKPPKGARRSYFLAQGDATGDFYINFDTHADAGNGITVPAGQFYERERGTAPQNYIYLKGSVAAPALQRILITEGVE